jgi:hypothetical protein
VGEDWSAKEGRRRARLIEGGAPSTPPLPLLNGSIAGLGLMRGRDRYKSTGELSIEDEGARAHKNIFGTLQVDP